MKEIIISILKIKFDFRMRDINQKIIKFNFDENFDNNDFYVSKSNEHTYNLINKWPNWEKNFKYKW